MANTQFSTFKTKSKDGTNLYGHYLKPIGETKALVLFVHGLGGHSGRFYEPAKLFAQEQIASIGIDLRGNGMSEGKRGHVKNFKAFQEDIDACISFAENIFSSDLPKLIFGNSMGGAIALKYATINKYMFSGIVLTAPWFQLSHPISPIKFNSLKLLSYMLPLFSFSSKVKPNNTIQENQSENHSSPKEEDLLIHKRISARLFMMINTLGNQLLSDMSCCHIPTIIVHSKNDPVTSFNASQQLCDKHPLATKLIEIDFYTHEVPLDANNNFIFKQVKKYLDKIIVTHANI